MKLLVTTDFSTNSKGAIRFAQTLAEQFDNVEVVFYHAVHFLRPTKWSDIIYDTHKVNETERLGKELKKFINSTLKKHKSHFASVEYVIDTVISTEKDIITYAEKNSIDFICIATRGAGILRKVMGTHTAYIVNNSSIPVLVVPNHYRVKKLQNATYLSDFENLKGELEKATAFQKAFNLNLEVLHFKSMLKNSKGLDAGKSLLAQPEYKTIKLNITKTNYDLTFVERVAKYIRNSKTDLLITFTNRKRDFFESIFLPSTSAELTYSTKVPILIYTK
ncbi:MAG: universal stress protein [Spirosomataceae bacterium]